MQDHVIKTLGKNNSHNPSLQSPIKAPIDGGVVHLVDEDDQVFDTRRLGQHGVFPCLAALLETRLKLSLPGWDHLVREGREGVVTCQTHHNSPSDVSVHSQVWYMYNEWLMWLDSDLESMHQIRTINFLLTLFEVIDTPLDMISICASRVPN